MIIKIIQILKEKLEKKAQKKSPKTDETEKQRLYVLDFDGDIKSKDLRDYTPYNTYRINGLPPTPIAMPSKAAILAAVNPPQSDYVYFVSKGDGSHQFSTTLKQHNVAVNTYILNKKN